MSKRRFFSKRNLVIAIPNFWLILFFMVPFLVVLKISLAEPRIAIPPYSPLWEWGMTCRRRKCVWGPDRSQVLCDEKHILLPHVGNRQETA